MECCCNVPHVQDLLSNRNTVWKTIFENHLRDQWFQGNTSLLQRGVHLLLERRSSEACSVTASSTHKCPSFESAAATSWERQCSQTCSLRMPFPKAASVSAKVARLEEALLSVTDLDADEVQDVQAMEEGSCWDRHSTPREDQRSRKHVRRPEPPRSRNAGRGSVGEGARRLNSLQQEAGV